MAWYLKKSSGDVYGPVDLPTLQLWATDGRVAADDQASEDRQRWKPAPDIPELGMDWRVQLPDGSSYGPVHPLALRDLIQDGSIARDARLTHRLGTAGPTASEALVPLLIEQNTKMRAAIDHLNARLQEAGKKAAPAPAAAPAADAEKAELRRQVDALAAQKTELQQQVEQWKTACETERAARQSSEQQHQAPSGEQQAVAREKQALQDEIEKLKKIIETERAVAAQREADVKAQMVAAQSAGAQTGAVQQEAEKWKKLYEEQQAAARNLEARLKEQAETLRTVTQKHDEMLERARQIKQAYDEEHAAMEAEKARLRQEQEQLKTQKFVPRDEVDELERKLAQVERNYQALLRNVNRNLNPGSGGPLTTSPDQLRRRDVS